MTDRVRALLITPAGDLLTIWRRRPGLAPYWVLPGGGVDDGESLEAALARELREEIAATASIHSLLYVLDHGDDRQYFYLGRVRSWSADPADRSGPEFTDPAGGEYQVELVPLTKEGLERINLQPDAIARFLRNHLRQSTDLFALPGLRTSQPPRA